MTGKISWDNFYIGLAYVVSRKSPDEESKHGCMLVWPDNRPLSMGLNGFMRGADTDGLPTTRPDKYKWMYHAERNAIANAELRPAGATAYVTGECCEECLYSLWQHGVKKVIYAKTNRSYCDSEWLKEFVKRTKIKLKAVKPDLNWLDRLVVELRVLGFVNT